MKNTKQRCSSCGAMNIDYLQVTNQTVFGYECYHCGYRWERPSMPKLSQQYPIELLERIEYLKDAIKLTKQDKIDLQIDLWQYGKR